VTPSVGAPHDTNLSEATILYACPVQGGILEKKLCDAMQCWIADRKICYTQAEQRAYVGTTCGNHKWCMKGKCISDPRAGTAKGS